MTSVSSSDSSATTSTTTSSSSLSSAYTKNVSSNSDIDWDALIEAAVLQKQLPADRIEAKMTQNETEIDAYSSMQDLLGDLLDSVEQITGVSESLTQKDDVFSSREAYLTGLGGADAENSLVVTAEAGVAIQTYELTIDQLATAQKVASETQESKYDALGYTGTFSLAMAGADIPTNDDGDEDATLLQVEIDETMSLAEVADEINTKTGYTGVTATVVAVNDSDYRLVLTGGTGADIEMTTVEGDDIGQALGLTDTDGSYKNELQSSQVAIFSVDGVEVTRDSNTIDDVVEGVTFSLYQTTGTGESIAVEIGQSLSNIKDAVVSLVDSYNAYREWAISQQEIDASGSVSSDAVLFGDNLLRSANTDVASALSSVIDSNSMSLLGLSYDENNYLELDEDELNDALLNDVDEIEDVLNFQYETSSSSLAVLRRNSNMPSELELNITVDADGNLASVTADGKSDLFEVDGSRIVGVAGSEYEGITFVYTGSEDATITFTSTAGIAEQLFQTLNKYTDEDDGLLTDKIATLTEQNEDYETEYNDFMDTVDAYEERLTTLYASYQAAIEAAQSSLDYLEAILNTGDN
nr:flagellar filament capping protein FliD [uncultured Cohaesibacter sp.]